MRRDFSLGFRCRIGTYHVAERLIRRRPPKPPGFPFSQVVLYAPLNRTAKNYPRLPHGARQDADAIKFVVCVFRPVAAAHRHGQPHDVAAQFQPALRHRGSDDVCEQRVACHDDVCAGHDHAYEHGRQSFEEVVQIAAIFHVEDCEPRQRRAPMSVKGGRNAPNAAPALSQLFLLFVAVLDQSIRRVGHDGMDRVGLAIGKPFKTVRQNESGLAGGNRNRTRPPVTDCSRDLGHWINFPVAEARSPEHKVNAASISARSRALHARICRRSRSRRRSFAG